MFDAYYPFLQAVLHSYKFLSKYLIQNRQALSPVLPTVSDPLQNPAQTSNPARTVPAAHIHYHDNKGLDTAHQLPPYHKVPITQNRVLQPNKNPLTETAPYSSYHRISADASSMYRLMFVTSYSETSLFPPI